MTTTGGPEPGRAGGPDAHGAGGSGPARLSERLSSLSPQQFSGLQSVDAVAVLEQVFQLEAWLASVKARAVHRIDAAVRAETLAATNPTGNRSGSADAVRMAGAAAVAEIACVLLVPEAAAGFLINDSTALVEHFPLTLKYLRTGMIHQDHARTITRAADGIPATARLEFELALLSRAKDQTRPQLAARARRLREKLHPEALDIRHRDALAERCLALDPAQDGMAYLTAYLPAAAATAVYNRTTAAGIRLQSPGEDRTLAQLRADCFTDAVLDGLGTDAGMRTGAGTRIKADVLVTIPMLTLLGRSRVAGELNGYGPIPAAMARDLAAGSATLMRLFTNPVDGAILNVGREHYKTPKALRRYVQVRDKSCRFPGCNRQTRFCDIVHTTDWANNGATEHQNLAYLCPAHPRLKHEAGWNCTQPSPGTLSWTSLTGRVYTTTADPPYATDRPRDWFAQLEPDGHATDLDPPF